MFNIARERHYRLGASAERFKELLQRYPGIAEQEVETMIALYPQLTILDVDLLSADNVLARPFGAFLRSHGDRLNHSWTSYFVYAVGAVGALVIIAWLACTMIA